MVAASGCSKNVAKGKTTGGQNVRLETSDVQSKKPLKNKLTQIGTNDQVIPS